MHLSLNQPPMMRKANELIAIQIEVLDKVVLKRMIFSLLNEDQINKLLQNLELNTAVTILMIEGVYRFRLNVLVQQSSFEAVFHFIPNPVPEIKDLNLPSSINSFADLESGLVICAGPARSGKTTTCAALLDRINKEYIKSILTLQEPVEYVFPISQSIIRQREVGVDTQSFKHGLEQSIFQDVDVIMVSRLDNAQTAELALYAALSGKLVFVTLTSLSSVDALQKIINFFPSERQYHVRMMLANCLRAVIFQKLLPMQKKPGTLIPATEILLSNKELRHIIIDGFFEKIMFILENDRAAVMHSLKQSITKLWEGGVIASSIINALNE
ncbi:MAG: Flp pilus assembly complex ATPase component TadA [Candidatus Omnitrophica bacterium]|nr:Flp pilus assembly complex ATPase component TadA [Candidatus Omnitrophota bacterium]